MTLIIPNRSQVQILHIENSSFYQIKFEHMRLKKNHLWLCIVLLLCSIKPAYSQATDAYAPDCPSNFVGESVYTQLNCIRVGENTLEHENEYFGCLQEGNEGQLEYTVDCSSSCQLFELTVRLDDRCEFATFDAEITMDDRVIYKKTIAGKKSTVSPVAFEDVMSFRANPAVKIKAKISLTPVTIISGANCFTIGAANVKLKKITKP